MKKSSVLLFLCDDLKMGKKLKINKVCNLYEISIPTFRRYISALREYFLDRYNKDIVYDKDTKSYLLVDDLS